MPVAVAGFRPGDVEPHDLLARCRTASSAISSDRAVVRIAVRRARMVMGRPALPSEALQDRLDHLVERETALQVQLRREAHLRVHHAVRGEVLGALGGHARERLAVCITATVWAKPSSTARDSRGRRPA